LLGKYAVPKVGDVKLPESQYKYISPGLGDVFGSKNKPREISEPKS
jgi:hypothetical protein